MQGTSVEKLAESKLTILYLLKEMGIPMSKGQIGQFALEANYIEYFSLQGYIAEMLENKFIREIKNIDKLIYTNTPEGEKMLSLFVDRIPNNIKEKVDQYVDKMQQKIKNDLETRANYSHIGENSYQVICGLYENEKVLLELKLNLGSKEQAIVACKNWKTKTDAMYLDIVTKFLTQES